MPRKREEERRRESPRTDLPPRREPYYDGYFGTEEEQGVERESDAGEDARDAERDRSAAEDAAGGDREI